MKVNFDLYNVFYYVCKFKSITKTANFLYVSQPAITKHIKNLEKYLGKTLIVRTSKGIEITDDGMFLYNEIKDSIENLNSVGASFKEKNDNYEHVIRIVAGYSTIKKLLLKAVLNFNKKHPSTRFEICSYNYKEAIQKLRDGEVDLIIINIKDEPEKYNDIIVKKCYELHDTLIANNEVKNKYPDEIKLVDINKYPIICKNSSSISRRYVEDYLKSQSIEFAPKYQLSNNWLIEEYIYMDFGIGILPREFALENIKNGKFKEIKTDIQFDKRDIGYAVRKNSINYSILHEFTTEIVNNLRV